MKKKKKKKKAGRRYETVFSGFAGKWTITSIVALSCALVPAQFAAAEEKVSEDEPYVTQTVTVTATRVEKDLMEVPASVTVIDAEQVRHSSARTLGELLEDVPGVQIQNDGSQGMKRLSIRGENAFHTLVLIDGQKISEHKSMSGPMLLIDPSRIERVEVIKGPASVLYGSDAIGGVVNVITKKGGEKPVQGSVHAGYHGASEGFSTGASLFGKVGGFNYRLTGSYADHDDFRSPDGTVENTWFRQKDAGVFLSYDFSEHFTLGANYDYFNGRFNASTGNVEEFFVKLPKWTREKYNVFAEAKDISEWLTRVRLDAFYQKTDKDMENFVDSSEGASTMQMDNFARNYLRTKGVTLQTDWRLGSANQLIVGYEFVYDDLDSPNRVYMKMGQPAGRMTVKLDYYRDRFYEGGQTTHAVFANMESKLPADFALTYGSRWTHVKSKLDRADAFRTGSGWGEMMGRRVMTMFDDDHAPVTDSAEVGSESYSRPVFNVGAVWTGIEDLALRANWSQGFHAPILTEKFIGTSMGGGNVLPNPNLDPETSNNFEVGARWNPGPASIDWAFFYSLAKDYISTTDVLDANGNDTGNDMYTNVDKARTIGSELTAGYRFDTDWGVFRPYATLTWMRRRYEREDGTSTYNTSTPQWFGRYGVRYRKPLNEYMDLRADVFGRSQSSATSSSGTRYSGFTTANLALGLDFGKSREFSLDAEVLNIFDKRYQYPSNPSLEPGVHANLRLSYNF